MIALFLAAASTPMPGAIRTFADWTVGCDNGRSCQAVGLLPEDDIPGSTMVIARGPTPDAIPEVRINIQQGSASSLSLDGQRLPTRTGMIDGVAHIDRADSLALVRSIRNGQQIEVLDRAGKQIGTVSLRGLTAALIYMDDQQKRVGLRSALGRPGTIPDSDVEAPPAIPVIVRPKTTKLAPRRLTAADIARQTRSLGCEPGQQSGDDITYARLDRRTTLALLPFPCANGAYNFFSYALLIDEQGKVRPAAFDLAGGLGSQDHELVNALWNPAAGKLASYSKGRGLGDCGVIQHHAWDGSRFRLIDRAEMQECRGSIDFIQTWIAEAR
jgi:Protein of unknown function (DUF1176)